MMFKLSLKIIQKKLYLIGRQESRTNIGSLRGGTPTRQSLETYFPDLFFRVFIYEIATSIVITQSPRKDRIVYHSQNNPKTASIYIILE